jgi:hypothetical protein
MTAYMKPQDRGIYQEAEAQILASQQDGRGNLAVRHADPRLKALEAGKAGLQMDRTLQYGRLGMDKKRMEHEVKMGEGQLAINKERTNLVGNAFKWDLKQQSKATNIAKFGVALNLAFGLTGFVQKRKLMKQMEETAALDRMYKLAAIKQYQEEIGDG